MPAAPAEPTPVPVDEAAGVTVITEPLGGSRLSRAIQSGEIPAEWRLQRPQGVSGWRRRVETVRARFPRGEWLDRVGAAIRAHPRARARLERVAAEDGILITTGQQPGLFGGPIYTWSKAVTALALADALERELGVAASPLFWAATDDADLIEAQTVWLASSDGAVVLRGSAQAPPGMPAAVVPQGTLSAEIAALRDAAGSASHEDLLAAVIDAYGDPHRAIGEAYLRILEATLGPLGIPVLDASHDAIAAAADPLLRRALGAHVALGDALAQRSEAIRARGFDPQVDDVRDLTPVFVYEGSGAKRRVPTVEADTIAADSGQRLGPNVLLRPIVEAALLPTAAYVAGPGELAYFAQVTALADAVGATVPVAVPRWAGTLDEPRMARTLTRLGLERGDLATPDRAETRLARAAVPEALGAALDRLRSMPATAVDDVRSADEPSVIPAGVLDGVQARLQHQVERLHRRVVAAVKRRDAARMLDVARARGFYFPGGKRQERALSIVPTLARYGRGVLDAMYAAARRHADALVRDGDGRR